jgi:Reverse transcriptase (RNA-dependent DNA polymerase)/RNase H-like domain found in reverse transcriptase
VPLRDTQLIRVEPDNVWKTLFNTLDGTMVSNVMQQGDCNAPTMYQTLMNYLFSVFIGVFMDVYLNDIIIYSDSISDHLKHCRTVLAILRQQKLYLSTPDKLQFFATKLKILGHVIDDNGIVMDPDKVDPISKWKTPTNWDLLLQFVGAAGYVAENCPNLRIESSVLSTLTGSTTIWRWGPMQQCAFEAVKNTIQTYRDSHHVAIDYGAELSQCPVSLTIDASQTGGGGVITQGKPPHVNVIAFWSGKFNPAQQNYPVHECELLAIIESLK